MMHWEGGLCGCQMDAVLGGQRIEPSALGRLHVERTLSECCCGRCPGWGAERMQAARDQRFQLTGRLVLVGLCNTCFARCSQQADSPAFFCAAGWPGRIPADRTFAWERTSLDTTATLNNLMQAPTTHVAGSSSSTIKWQGLPKLAGFAKWKPTVLHFIRILTCWRLLFPLRKRESEASALGSDGGLLNFCLAQPSSWPRSFAILSLGYLNVLEIPGAVPGAGSSAMARQLLLLVFTVWLAVAGRCKNCRRGVRQLCNALDCDVGRTSADRARQSFHF